MWQDDSRKFEERNREAQFFSVIADETADIGNFSALLFVTKDCLGKPSLITY